MFCRYCGSELPENANFCFKCGKINEYVSNEQPPIAISAVSEIQADDSLEFKQADPFKKEKDDLGGSILKFAILGLTFGITVWFSLLGLIFSIIARAKVREYISKFNETHGRASVGKGLSVASMVVSITFFCLILFVLLGLIIPFA